ncbi:MAG: DNA-binding protein [Lachnospiraceae bacterium]
MEKIVMQALLYDFYGELLNDHQKAVYEDYVYNDIGISEIAAERGISRQGVHDLIKRCSNILQDYENKLHLVERFQKTKELVARINSLTEQFERNNDLQLIDEIRQISNHILDDTF